MGLRVGRRAWRPCTELLGVFRGSLRASLRGTRAVVKAQNLFMEARHSISQSGMKASPHG